MTDIDNNKILVVDDDGDIWRVYRAVLTENENEESPARKMARLLNPDRDFEVKAWPSFELTFAAQGNEAVDMVEKSRENGSPFAVAFIDIRMPPGPDGMDTAASIRRLDPDVEIVIATAYSDRSRDEIVRTVGNPDKLLLLRKPFDHEELMQTALSLVSKWNLARREEMQRRQLETVLITSPAAIFTVDEDMNLSSWNPAATRITGYRAAEVIGNPCILREICLDGGCDECFICTKKQPSEKFREITIRDKMGRSRTISKSVTPISDSSGRIVMGVESFWDVTDLKNTQAYVKNIIDSMPSALVSVDKGGVIIQWNTEAERMAGLSISEAAGKYVGDVFPQMAELLDGLENTLRSRESAKLESYPFDADGEKRYADMVVYPLGTDSAEGAVIRIDDVTNRVRLEEIMIQSEKMMSVGGLAAGMAHEINNPLGVILQGIQNAFRRLSGDLEKNVTTAAELGTDLETVRSYLEKRGILRFLGGIRDAGMRASKIVSNMLNFSRTGEFRMTPNDLNKLTDISIDLAASDYDLKKTCNFKKIDIVREYDPDLMPVPCDATEIEQVILNILKNSVQAILSQNNENPRILVRTRQEKSHAVMEIEDNGPGMDPETRKRIFEPFYTTKSVGAGTGLGLSVSYFIITNNHKGMIAVDSEPGKGTVFTVRLPVEHKKEA